MFLVLVLFLVTFLCCLRWQRRRKVQCMKQFKNDFPLIGNLPFFLGNGEDKRRIVEAYGREALKQGGVTHFGSWLVDKFYIVIADPVAAELVLRNCLDKDDSTTIFMKMFRHSLIIAPVSEWRTRRKFINPVFAIKYLNQYFKIFRNNGDILTQQLKSKCGQGQFSIYNNMIAYSFDTIFEAMFGIRSDTQNNIENSEILRLKHIGPLIGERISQPLLYNETIYQMTPMYKRLKDVTDTLRNFIDKGIAKGYEKFTRVKADNDAQICISELKATPTILELMIEEYEGDLNIISEKIKGYLFAGTDTTSVVLSFTCLMLAKYPEVQEKVYQEIREILGDGKRPIECADIPRLKYTEAVLRETLRVYTLTMLLLRKIDKDLTLPSGQVLVKGTSAIIHVWAIHRNPQYWGHDAELFRPERFFDAPPKHPAAFLPFSYGPRNCVGYQFALNSMKTTVASLIRHYRVLPASVDDVGTTHTHKREERRTTFGVIIRDVQNFPIRLQARE